MDILDQIEKNSSSISAVRDQLFGVKKLQLHSGVDGFDSPDSYGIYKASGGKVLGVVGKVFEPIDLNLFMDSIELSITECDVELDLDKLAFNEFRGGQIVDFTLPLKPIEVKASKVVGDITKVAMYFRTGFNGKQKLEIGFKTFRLWCANGCGHWKKGIQLAWKNTKGNIPKVYTYCDEMYKVIEETQTYQEFLNALAKVEFNQKDLDKFMTKLTGYDVKEYNELTTKKRNILDRINESVAIETNDCGNTLYGLLQGVTRYTNHVAPTSTAINEGKVDEYVYFGTGATLNSRAQSLLFDVVSN